MPSNVVKEKIINDTFTGGDGRIVSNVEILELFRKTLFPSMSKAGSYPETLFRIGDTHKPMNLSLILYGDSRAGGSIYTVNTPEFAKAALTEIQNYRIINDCKVEGIYKVVEKLSNEPGVYVLTYEREPKFKIEVLPTRWIARQMTFEECEGISAFRYLPDLEGRPRKVTIKTSVAQRAREEERMLVKKLFLSFHEQLKKRYQEIGMTPAEE